MSVFDCFTFWNELDLCEFRMELLNDVVDYFVIAEANYTHSGKPKPYLFDENIQRYKKWKNKIIYLPVELSVEGMKFHKSTQYCASDPAWVLETEQRNGLWYVKDMVQDEDLVLIGDLDEIPDPNVIKTVGMEHTHKCMSYAQMFHYYYMNCRMRGYDEWWKGTVQVPGRMFKQFHPQAFRENRNNFSYFENAGWHFSYLGGVEKIKQKIQSFAHTEYDREDIVNDEHLLNAIANGEDLFHRPGLKYKVERLMNYPEYLVKEMVNYPQFLKADL